LAQIMARKNGSVLDRVPTGARVAVVRLRSLGDCVLTTPALALLKRARPDVEIGVVVEDRFAGVFESNPAVSTLLAPDYGAILRWRPRLCLNLHGGTRSMLLTIASLAPIRAGFGHHRGAAIYNVKIPRAQEILSVDRTVHTAEHLASAMFYLGVPAAEIPGASLFACPRPAARPYAIIHATSAAAYKSWRPEGFLAVAEHLAKVRDLEPVFIGGASDDLTQFRKHRIVAGAPLPEVKSLLSGASMFVGNDSGPAHMAAALGVPVVVLFGRLEHEAIWAPWRARACRTLASAEGIAGIRTEAVIAAIEQLG
jgi:ADP-heptose:LPS heptosyltransferase